MAANPIIEINMKTLPMNPIIPKTKPNVALGDDPCCTILMILVTIAPRGTRK